MTGTVYDTYVAALQHDAAAIPDDAVRLGVVRRPTPWFYLQVDENYDDRYLAHLDRSEAAQAALDRVRDRLDRGTDVALVCYENTDHKRCHRTLLRERLVADRGQSSA